MPQELNGLIQHAFALRVPPELRPAYAADGIENASRLLRAIFAPNGCGFHLGNAGMTPGDSSAPWWDRSLLLAHRQTTIQPRRVPTTEPPSEETGEDQGSQRELPGPLGWAADGCGERLERREWHGLAITGTDRPEETEQKDFLITPSGPEAADGGSATSKILTQLLAHRRSRLFGLPLARETINILLPHALLHPENGGRGWLAQPGLSLFYVYGRRSFRPIFSFSLFLIPCAIEKASGSTLEPRSMTSEEIQKSVRYPWSLATAFKTTPVDTFEVSGPLVPYLGAIAPAALGAVGIKAGNTRWADVATGNSAPLTVRSFTEATFFALSLRMTRPSRGVLSLKERKEIGDRMLTALSASRVSSVALVADNCEAASDSGETASHKCRPLDPPMLLRKISAEISNPYRMPPLSYKGKAQEDARRLDRAFFDTTSYAMGVLPADRCVVSVGDRCAQKGFQSSALLEAIWTAYMVSGAAIATGMIRNVFRDIAQLDRSKPDSIADLEREAIVDLHETYDLEITTEIYRSRYRLLREQLGINAEYDALSDKLEALYRETNTRFEGRSERRLMVLTWAIAILSSVIAAGTLVLIFKPDA